MASSSIHIPVGYLFAPTDKELLVQYLKKKILSQKLPCNIIPEIHLYNFSHPKDLTERFMPLNDRKGGVWYFFTPLKQKHGNGKRIDRTTGPEEGFWRANGKPKTIKDRQNNKLGVKRTLVYRKGKAKTNWIIHEYSIDDNMKWVLCKLYENHSEGNTKEDSISEEIMKASHAAPQQPISDVTMDFPHVDDDSEFHSDLSTFMNMGYDRNLLLQDVEPLSAVVPFEVNNMSDAHIEDYMKYLLTNYSPGDGQYDVNRVLSTPAAIH